MDEIGPLLLDTSSSSSSSSSKSAVITHNDRRKSELQNASFLDSCSVQEISPQFNFTTSHDLPQSPQQEFEEDEDHHIRTMSPREQQHSVDVLMAKELNQLTFRERNDINEEIHGVSSRYDLEETPELISRSLQELEFEITYNVPMYRKAAYHRSQQLYNLRQQQQTYRSKSRSCGYINDIDFRLLFLRRDLFDVPKAAIRLVNFMELVYELWGEIALTERTWKFQKYLSPFELEVFRSGNMQCLPGRDRAGRRIMGNFADNTTANLSVHNRLRLSLYLIMNVVEGDVVTQQKGYVGITMWHNISIDDFQKRGKCHKRMAESIPMRVSAIHVCLPHEHCTTIPSVSGPSSSTMPSVKGHSRPEEPETSKTLPQQSSFNPQMLRIMKAIFVMSIGAENRPHLRVHIGSTVECLYALQSFGILAEQIPINTATGRLKTKEHRKWMGLALQREKALEANVPFRKIECPMIYDILFGRGWPIMAHPGNAVLRQIIDSRLEDYKSQSSKRAKTAISLAIVSSIKKKGGRFLKEDPDGWWVEVTNEMARQKVSVAFRDAHKLKTVNTSNGVTGAKESVGRQHKDGPPNSVCKRKKVVMNDTGGDLNRRACNARDCNDNEIYNCTKSLNDSSTSAFLGMDGFTGKKKPRCFCVTLADAT